jgi:serine/threonine protein kinase
LVLADRRCRKPCGEWSHLAAGREHPNTARVYDSGLDRGVHYYAMEYVKGVALDDHVKTHGLSHIQW